MKLRTKKRILNVASLGLVGCAALMLWQAWHAPPPPIDVQRALTTPNQFSKQATDADAQTVASLELSNWNRILRQPLYDPPPPPKQEVVVERRPITVKLVGTVIEGENSQAFVRQPSGQVEIKRLGEQVTADVVDGVIADITPVEIVIRRDDGEHRVSVDGRN